MSRGAMLLAAMVVALVVGSGVALASHITNCTSSPCLGTDGEDVIQGTNASDTIKALAGDDLVKGFGGNDTIYGAATATVAPRVSTFYAFQVMNGTSQT